MSGVDEWDQARAPGDDQLAEAAPHHEQPGAGQSLASLAPEPATPPVKPTMIYESVNEFVTYWFADTYARYIGTGAGARTWCPMWWKHPEAIVRLEAIWRAWEHLRQKPDLGMSVWLIHHADPNMAVLLSDKGPFMGCTPQRGHKPQAEPLPLAEPNGAIFAPEPPAAPTPSPTAQASQPGGEVSAPSS